MTRSLFFSFFIRITIALAFVVAMRAWFNPRGWVLEAVVIIGWAAINAFLLARTVRQNIARLQASVEVQRAANKEQVERNRQLGAEVADLKNGGYRALEERARSELGMVGNSETFYQVVTPSTAAPAKAGVVTARAQ